MADGVIFPLLALSRLRMGTDGKGVTTLIAGAGCPLRCRWCINKTLLASAPAGGRVLDLGTGSGAIAVAAAVERPDLIVTAADISPRALDTARTNAKKYGAKIRFAASDLFAALGEETFDFIAANLPYVSEAEYETLQPEVRDHEPRSALTAPDGGFAVIARAAAELPCRLAPGGRAAFELSPPQAPRLVILLQSLGLAAYTARDLAGRDRFVFAERS